MKIELNYYEITFYGFFICNLFNLLDGILTYIGLFIIPKGVFQESNLFALNMFNTVGFFNSFIFKICVGLFITLFLILIVNNINVTKLNTIFKTDKDKLIINNVLVIYFYYCLAFFSGAVLNNTLYLIKYYF